MNKRVIQFIASVIVLAALVVGRPVSYPDNVHTVHGFPFVWGTHQLVTIAGSVDYWMVSQITLALDTALWLTILMMLPDLVENYNNRKEKKS